MVLLMTANVGKAGLRLRKVFRSYRQGDQDEGRATGAASLSPNFLLCIRKKNTSSSSSSHDVNRHHRDDRQPPTKVTTLHQNIVRRRESIKMCCGVCSGKLISSLPADLLVTLVLSCLHRVIVLS
jgi:hypothetical protein